MAKSRAAEVIAALVCEDDDFVLGQDAIWHRPAINASICDLVKSSNNSKLEVAEVATKLGVSPADVRSLEEEGILVAEGFVISKPRIIQEIQSLAKVLMKETGYVDVTELSAKVGLYSLITLSLMETALRDVEHTSKQEYQLKAEKERLLKGLEEATTQTVQIPPELRSWAADVCKSNPKLQGGNIINMGTEYEPRALREERTRLLKQRLAEGFAIDESETKYLDQATRSNLTKLYSKYCTSALTELISAHVMAEITESGCCSVAEVFSAFESKLDIAEKELMEAIKLISKDSNSSGELRLVGDTFIFRKSDVDAFRLNGDDSFCKSEDGKNALQSLLQNKSQQQPSTEILLNISSFKSKSELESLFSNKLWPELLLYTQGLTKLKRTGQLHSLLTEFLLESDLKMNIYQVLEALLRIDLQLGPKEPIPEEEYQAKLKPLVVESSNNNLDKFERELKSLASLKYGLSCLPIDKKQEKDLVGKLRGKWTTKKNQSELATWCDLFSLGILHVFKMAVYLPSSRLNDNVALCRRLWESSKTVLSFPPDFIKWSDEHLLKLLSHDATVAGGEEKYLVSMLDDVDGFLNQCARIK